MGTLTRRRRGALQLMMAELMMIASWETIARRSLPGPGTCSPANTSVRLPKKAAAIQQSVLAMLYGRGKREALAPWYKRATANAKRLQRRGERLVLLNFQLPASRPTRSRPARAENCNLAVLRVRQMADAVAVDRRRARPPEAFRLNTRLLVDATDAGLVNMAVREGRVGGA